MITDSPDANGDTKVELTVSDGTTTQTQTIEVMVAAVDDAPDMIRIPSQSFDEDGGVTISLSKYITDRDTDFGKLTFSVTAPDGSPVEAHVTDGKLVITGLPDANGDTKVELTVSDGTTTQTQTIEVMVAAVDDAPDMIRIPSQSFDEDGGVTISLSKYITDRDTDFGKLTFSVTAPDGSPVEAHVTDGKLVITGIPDANGDTKVELTVSDGTTTQTQTIEVMVAAVDDAPDMIRIPSQSFDEDGGVTISLSKYITDRDTDFGKLTFSVTAPDGSPVEAHVTDGKLVITGLPDANGDTKVELTVSDGTTTQTQTIEVMVAAVDDAPDMIRIPSQSFDEDGGVTISLSSYITDRDTDFGKLTFSVTAPDGSPVEAHVTDGKLVITGLPDANGDTKVELTVSDGTTTQTQTIEVMVAAVDDAPDMIRIPSQSFDEDGGVTISLSKYITDRDTDFGKLTFSVTAPDGSPVEAHVTDGKLVITGLPDANGDTKVELTVSDGTTTQTQTIEVMVAAVDDAPDMIRIPSQSFDEDGGVTISLSKYITDRDTDFGKLTFSVTAPDGSPVEAHVTDGKLVITGLPDANGDTKVELTVSDGTTTQTQTIEVMVAAVDDAPDMIRIPSQSFDEDGGVT